MRDDGKFSVLGIDIAAVDYESAVEAVIDAAHDRRHLSVSALAVHGVMTGVDDPVQRHRLNSLDLVVPDGQPVRWALRLLHRVRLVDRVYGPTLTLRICEAASAQGVSIFLYGSMPDVLNRLESNLTERFPSLEIAGRLPSLFRAASSHEQQAIAERIVESGASICFVGLGCPRQETFAYEHRDLLPMPVIAVGAAFDFHAGLLDQAPPWMREWGLEWLFRLRKEPRRLWRRYVYLNPRYLIHVGAQRAGREYPRSGTPPVVADRPG